MPRLLRSQVYSSRLCAFILMFAGASISQDTSTGAIRGTVVDASGGRVPGANIALVNGATGFRYGATSDAEGQFSFQLLPPGDYSGRATAEKMSPQLTPKLHVDLGGTTEIEFKLAVA